MVSDKVAKERATLKDSGVIDARNLKDSHKRLTELLKPGMSVLDVGCGTGAITSGIANMVGASGRVVGIDNHSEFIEKARQHYNLLSGLTFEKADIYQLPFYNEFDIVTSSRVLQWLAKPQEAVRQMVQSIKQNGKVIVLDYNHTKICWEPEIPETMQNFYDAFLKWRFDAGMDNEIADHLPAIFEDAGLTNIKVTVQHEITKRSDPNSQRHMTLWAEVAASRGIQLVNDGYITEIQRASAEADFRKWVSEKGESQTMYLLAVEGIKEHH